MGDSLWIVGGDFNLIRLLQEKKGGVRRLDQKSIAFDGYMQQLKLMDIPTVNGLFTLNN